MSSASRPATPWPLPAATTIRSKRSCDSQLPEGVARAPTSLDPGVDGDAIVEGAMLDRLEHRQSRRPPCAAGEIERRVSGTVARAAGTSVACSARQRRTPHRGRAARGPFPTNGKRIRFGAASSGRPRRIRGDDEHADGEQEQDQHD